MSNDGRNRVQLIGQRAARFVLGVVIACAGFNESSTIADEPSAIPSVMLSAGHAALCRVQVGDAMPTPKLADLDGKTHEPTALAGEKATVVVLWHGDNPMSRTLLRDLRTDVVAPFRDLGVTVVGVAVRVDEGIVRKQLKSAGASIPVLLDSDGKAFAQVGSGKLPRIYVLNAEGVIVWFDIEYSRATRRELKRTLRAMTK